MEELKEGWRKVKLGEICNISSSKRIFMSEYVKNGIPFYRGKEIIEKSLGKDTSTKLYISESKYNDIAKKYSVPLKKDILLTSVGTIGVPYLVRDEKFYFKDGNLTWLNDFKKNIDSYFIYYWLKSKKGQEQIQAITIGSTQKALTIENLKKLELLLPDIKIQKKIISILSSLDEKIELNRKINQNLEETAQTLFKRWFVDFEFPNEEEKPYKSSGGKMIESELGEIPERWRVGKLGEIIEINPKENLKKLEKKIYIEMKCLSETSSIISEYYEREFTGTGTKFKNKDTLMARITPCLENGKIGYVNFLEDNDIGWGSTEFNILRSQNNIPKELSYFIARSKNFLDYAISNMNGSSGRQSRFSAGGCPTSDCHCIC